MTPQVSVVVPVYNEAENVSELQRELASALKEISHEILFVDDGSQDRTVDQIDFTSSVRVLEFEKNAGQSAAIYAGLMAARGHILVLIDGDLQNDPRDIPRLRKDTWFKRIQSQIANSVRSRFTKDGVRDTGCTLKAMRRECVEALVPFHGMHRFIPALIKGFGYKITEIPVNHRARLHGFSKYSFGNRALHATVDMFGVRWLLGRQIKIRIKPGR
jgi:dolichol-phosphate mannosyltransferase